MSPQGSVPTGSCLPQSSVTSSFTGGAGVSPGVERQRQTLGETEAETGVSKQVAYGEEVEGDGHREQEQTMGLHCSPQWL